MFEVAAGFYVGEGLGVQRGPIADAACEASDVDVVEAGGGICPF